MTDQFQQSHDLAVLAVLVVALFDQQPLFRPSAVLSTQIVFHHVNLYESVKHTTHHKFTDISLIYLYYLMCGKCNQFTEIALFLLLSFVLPFPGWLLA